MSAVASVGQAVHFARPQSLGAASEASESAAEEAGESAAQEAAEGGRGASAAPPGTGQIVDITA